ncbi:MAG: ABC transporter transmembrane domain-containing protein [Ktedonobacteraceae bacterium]
MIRFLWRNLKGYRFLVFITVAMVIAQVGANLLIVFPLKFLLDKIVNHRDPNFPFIGGMLDFFDRFGTNAHLLPGKEVHTQLGVILFSCSMFIVLGLVVAILSYIELFLASYVAQHLSARLRKQLFAHLERLSLDWHGKQKKGDLVQRVTSNITDIEKLVTDGLVDFLSASLIIVGVIVVMLLTSWQFTILSIVILPALILVVASYTFGIKGASKKASKAAGQVANVATEDVGAITVLKAFTLEERESIRFTKYVDKNRKAGLRAGGLQAQFTPLVGILVAIATAIIYGVGSYAAAGNNVSIFGLFTIPGIGAGAITFGTLTVFLGYFGQFYQPIRDLSKLTNLGTNAASGAERIQEVLDAAPEISDSSAPYYGPTKLKGDILYENVIFGYSKDHPILKGINLHIAAGKKVALVGLSGGGKTTLVKLIPRFYEIQEGSVRLDGADNRMYPLAMLRQNVSMVLQDSVLFEGTIRENIEIGRPGATDEEIIDAAKKAQIHDTVMKMDLGYATEVREQGKNFSGGQRQRLAIARAILRDAPILVLDEPTASLDVEAEAEVMHALDKLVVGRTVLMISHRLSTLGNVDEIIVLKDGRIAEQGNFRELKKKGGIFANLLEEQNRYNVDRAGDKSILRSAFAELPPMPAAYGQRQVPPPAPALRPTQPAYPQPNQSPVPVAQPVQGYPYNNGQHGQQVPQTPAAANYISQPARVLIEMDGKIIGERELNKPILSVGRLSGNDVQVPSQRVSRLHAKIRWENSAWVIEDADSVNGLIYQGSRVERLVLNDGDRISIAPTAALHFKVTR